ncbi:winged helix-turn-helix domain-containing protein [Salinigranum rubrum]|uniref:Winged helix-turn-helix domain-containing protein n=1 Tax=Salinigranum rubrum TaxID=755307 RepID=A0A2I8VLU3_9EURY|nr:winged helix-turn-helix domain-containing protein [Salinigranum rubrum]
MRLSANWMSIADDRILEFLHEEGPRSPSKIHEDGRVRFSRQHINMRCKKLEEYDLVQNLGNGVYSITEQGREYLEGDIDANEL